MYLLADIEREIREILASQWVYQTGRTVPEVEAIARSNKGVNLDATILYADLARSTELVKGYHPWFVAEIYKVYLLSAAKVLKNKGGVITAYDGDRVMAVFLGEDRNKAAVWAALEINHIVQRVINPAILKQFPTTNYQVSQAVGIDSGLVLVAKAGIHNDNDLVWVGKPANYAAKLCSLRNGSYSSFITESVFSSLPLGWRQTGAPPQQMWEKVMWTDQGIPIYQSHYMMKPQ